MISKEELHERIKLRKESELKILRLNGANAKALEKRLEHLDEQRKEENDRHEEKLLELQKDIENNEKYKKGLELRLKNEDHRNELISKIIKYNDEITEDIKKSMESIRKSTIQSIELSEKYIKNRKDLLELRNGLKNHGK